MATHASTLLLLAVVIGLASLASYLFSQWRTRRGSETFALAGLGIGTALLLAAVFMVVLGVLLVMQQWLSRLNETASANETDAHDIVTPPHPFASVALDLLDIEIQSDDDDEHRNRARAASTSEQPHRERTQESSARANVDTNPSVVLPPAPRRQSSTLLSASDPWTATRCVVPFKREWDDGPRWTIVNDCNVAVAIVVATCESAADECADGAWRYPIDGLTLPAKARRATTEVEETLYVNKLRHAACVVTHSIAVDLIGIDSRARTERWQQQFEEARAQDTCLSEVRRLTSLGNRSGMPIEALLGTLLYSRASP